jgi:putative SOS response-associated peptidase YedK
VDRCRAAASPGRGVNELHRAWMPLCVPRVAHPIHDRMPLILAPGDYARWLSDEPDPDDLMRPFPAEPMRMWPISIRVNKPENDDPSIVEPIELSAA